MRRFFGKIEQDKAVINGEEFLHLKTVLRMKEGDDVVVLDGSEREFICKITQMKKDFAIAHVESTQKCLALPKKDIALFQALTKREKMEMIVQKAVELGMKTLIPFSSEFCVAKDSMGKKDRLEKIVYGACKQCECSVPMKIADTLKFDDMLICASKYDLVLFANERAGKNMNYEELKKAKSIAIIVGPEGGFSEEEKKRIIDGGAKSISLGKRILRSETASIVMMGLASVIAEN